MLLVQIEIFGPVHSEEHDRLGVVAVIIKPINLMKRKVCD
jgi:hypothetical protein